MSRPSPLRVLLSPSAYYPHVGGIEEATRQLARHLRGRGHDVVVVTNRWPAQSAPEEIVDGVRVVRLPMELPSRQIGRFVRRAPAAAIGLLRLARAFRPSVAHVIGAGPNAAYALALRAPLVFTAQGEFGFDAHGVFERSVVLRRTLATVLRRADAVTACSRYVLDELGVPGRVIPNGVAPEDFAGARYEPNGLGRYVLAAARLVEGKGLDVLLHAAARAGVRVVIAGDGPERGALERLADELAVDARFLGPVSRDHLPGLMVGADSYCLPSRGEPFGIALLEAMAAGTPAVATAAGGVAEFARDGQNALLVPVDDPPALAAALVRLGSDAALRERLSSGGRETAAELSWDRIGRLYEGLYREVAR